MLSRKYTTGYKLYEDGLVEYLVDDKVRESGTIVEEVNGRYPRYNAHLTLGYHEASKLQFTIYGKKYRFYTKIKGDENMPEGKRLTAEDLRRQFMILANKQLELVDILISEVHARDKMISEQNKNKGKAKK
jgi:hypothetical protein